MRNHVINEIARMAEIDDRIMLLTGDLGFGVLESYAQKYPERYINTGISEQNMTSVAAGLALEGNMVFTYSIGNFPTLRCIEQIRNMICYHHANVKILSLGGGFAYGSLGMTHHATEDIAMMRSLPNMRVFAPADAVEAVACLKEACRNDEPAFIRMARGKEPNQHSENAVIDIKKIVSMTKQCGTDINILTTGTILSEGMKLQESLINRGLHVGIYSVPSVKPIDEAGIKHLAGSCKLLVTMEDHNVIGGLGGSVAEVLSEVIGKKASLLRIGLRDTYTEIVGSQEYLRDYYGLSAIKAIDKVLKVYSEITGSIL